MKKYTSLFNVAIVAALFTVMSSSCTKEDQTSQPETEVSSEVKIEVLQAHLAELINVDVSLISYDQKTQMFSMLSHEQISLEKLTEGYLRSLEQKK